MVDCEIPTIVMLFKDKISDERACGSLVPKSTNWVPVDKCHRQTMVRGLDRLIQCVVSTC